MNVQMQNGLIFSSSLHSVLPQSSEASVILEITTLGKEIHKSTEQIWKQIISIQEYQGENAVFSHCSYSSLFSVCLLSVQCFWATLPSRDFGLTVKAVSSVSSYQTKWGKKTITLWVLQMSLNNRFHVVIYYIFCWNILSYPGSRFENSPLNPLILFVNFCVFFSQNTSLEKVVLSRCWEKYRLWKAQTPGKYCPTPQRDVSHSSSSAWRYLKNECPFCSSCLKPFRINA